MKKNFQLIRERVNADVTLKAYDENWLFQTRKKIGKPCEPNVNIFIEEINDVHH